jgi:hypothetical protein
MTHRQQTVRSTPVGAAPLRLFHERGETMIRIPALVIVALLAMYGVYAFGQDRSLLLRSAVTTLTPIPSSSSSDASFAWFYDAANRSVYVCRALANSLTVDCKGKAELP